MQLKGRQMISQGPNTGIGLSAHIYSSKKRTQLWQLAWVIKLPFSFLGRLENCETLWQSLQGGANLVLPSGVLRGPRYITTFDNKVSFKHATHHNHQKGLSHLAYQDMQISRFTYELCYKIICFFFWSNAEPTGRTHKTWRSPRQTRTKVWRRPGNAKIQLIANIMLTRWPECGPIKCRFRMHPQMRSIDPAAFESSSPHSLARMKNGECVKCNRTF